MKKHSISRRIRNGLLLALVLIFAVSGVVARYISQREDKTSLVTAKDFYFTSDLLKSGGANYLLNAGTTSLTFQLNNFADALRYADDDITYTLSVTGAGASVSPASGTISNTLGTNSAAITLSGLQNGGTYTVTATGSAGYVQTLSATFTVQDQEASVYKHLDTSDPNYVVLTVWTKAVQGTASIAYPAALIPDNTDPVMENWTTGAGSGTDAVSFSASGYASHRYRFFGGGVTVGSFTVTVASTVAEGATP